MLLDDCETSREAPPKVPENLDWLIVSRRDMLFDGMERLKEPMGKSVVQCFNLIGWNRFYCIICFQARTNLLKVVKRKNNK
ncbi:hypothetical protein CEXT_723201 [Caerostris extrusa]|uniref:Uncharacterized protein n=1 Tax=Caerostris extrusa TaxID=172846 RepID=A0AAV4XXV9_CAEEX|nr:hypothetical protein CEXT_723201 [Caerostris extrusa]